MHGPTAPVGQQLGHVDVVPVHPARGVQEQLPVLAAGAVELVVAGAHGVDEVHVACPEPDEGVHRQLRVVLLSLRPGRLHLLQGLGQGLLVHVRRGVQTPREVAPGRDALFKHVGRRGLGVPALAHVGEAREGRPAPVLRELHVGQVRQVPLAGLLHVVLGAEDGCRELAVGQGVLAAPDHVDSVADPLRLVAVELEDQRGQPGRFHVGLASPPAEAGLQRRGVRELQGRFVPVALEAQGLQILGLCGEGLVHGDDVVQLARRRGDGRRAELAPVILLREHGLPRPGRIPARLEEVKEDLARRARQALPAIGEPQPAHPGLQHLQVLVEGADDAVLAAAHSQAQVPPLAHAPHDHLGAVPLGQELPPDLLQVLGVEVTAVDLAFPLPPVLELRRFACLPLAPVFDVGPVPDRLAPRDGAGGFVEEGVAVPAREGHGPLLLDRRLELVQQAALAVHVEHRGLAPDAEGSDLSGRDAFLPPLASDAGDCVEVREHLLNRQPHQLRELPGDAELVRPLFEGGLQDLVAAKQLVGDVPQGPEGLVQDGVHHHLVVHDLHGLLAEGPLPRRVQVVGLVGQLQDDVVRLGVAELREHGRLEVPGRLGVREPLALPGQGDVEVADGQALRALVGHAAVPAVSPDAPDDDGHVHHPVHPLVLEEVPPELGQLVVPVGLEAAEQLFGAPPEHDVIVGPLADEGLVAVVLPAGGRPADQLVVVLAGPGELAVRAAEHRVAEVVVCQRKGF